MMDVTTRLLLQKPNPDPLTGDFVDISVLNANADKLDAATSFTVATSTARPAFPFQGQAIIETDTGQTHIWGGSAWLPLLVGGAKFTEQVTSYRTLAADWAFGAGVLGDAHPRFLVENGGDLRWGPGATALDTRLYRHSVGNHLVTDGDFESNGLIWAWPPVGASSNAVAFNHGYGIFADNAGAGTDNTRFWLNGPNGGECVIGPRNGAEYFGSIRLRTDKTTASAANAYLDASMTLYKSTSSRRYKVNIRTEDFDHELLMRLRPVRFQDKRQFEEEGPTAREHVGLIAEEVHDLGLTEYVHYDDQGRPDGVQYERLTLGLLSIVKDMAARIEALEGRLNG